MIAREQKSSVKELAAEKNIDELCRIFGIGRKEALWLVLPFIIEQVATGRQTLRALAREKDLTAGEQTALSRWIRRFNSGFLQKHNLAPEQWPNIWATEKTRQFNMKKKTAKAFFRAGKIKR